MSPSLWGRCRPEAGFYVAAGSPELCVCFQGLHLGAKRTPPCGRLPRSNEERAVRADLPDLLCICTFSIFPPPLFLPFFCVDYSGFSCSLRLLRLAHLHPAGSSQGSSSCREKHVVRCRARLRAGRVRDREGTEDRSDARTGEWVCLEVFLWLQPKISQGSVPSPEVAAAKAEPGESIPRAQEGRRGTEVGFCSGGTEQGGRRVAGGRGA